MMLLLFYEREVNRMQRTEIKDFTQGNITRQLLVFALPLFLSNVLQIVYNMVDMIVVGQVLGPTGVSAVSVGGDVSNLLTFIAIGFANAGQVIIAKYIGGGKKEKIGKFIGTMSFFLLISAVALSIVGVLCQDLLLGWMQTPREAYRGAAEYSLICMLGLVFIYGYNVVSAILRGMGDAKHPFLFISIAAVINVILDVVFVVFLHMGTVGAALATVIGQAVSFLSCSAFLVLRRERFELSCTRSDFLKPNREMLGELVKLGIPMAIKTASIQVSKLFVNAWVNSYGIAESAFAGIANKLASVSNLVSAAINAAGSTMVGQNIAARQYERVKRILFNIAVITLSIALVMSVLICVFPNAIFGMFTDDASVLAIGQAFLPIAVLLFLGSAFRAIMNALMNGSGNTKVNFATAILDGILLRIGLALLFGLGLGMKHYGFWLGDALAGFTPFWIGLVFYFSGSWKKEKQK